MGAVGLGVSYASAVALTVRESPVVAVAEAVIQLTPGQLIEWGIQRLGAADKPVLVTGILVVLAVIHAITGVLARRTPWAPVAVYIMLSAAGGAAVLSRSGSTTVDLVPIAVGLVAWLLSLWLIAATLQDRVGVTARASGEQRRRFLMTAASLGVFALGAGVVGRFLGRGRRHVEQTRRLLRIDGVTMPSVPPKARVGLDGIAPWQTPAKDFYLIHTAIVVPTIDPDEWSLRIHGLVKRELVLTYADLLERDLTEMWTTLNCVSNPVGGDLVGNAWWSGVRLAGLLAEAGALPEADAVLQTSADGWTCGTPLAALQDARQAMLAVAMNGEALPIEHGFPVRTIVPGLYGYVSACKWVVDLEVTRFADITAYWTGKGWAEKGPVKIASRIDVPTSGAEVPAGKVTVGGVAWFQTTGISAVEVALDGGPWRRARIGRVPDDKTWVQWSLTFDVPPGDHLVRVRAHGKDGEWQTGAIADVVPDGATGWHEVDFKAVEA